MLCKQEEQWFLTIELKEQKEVVESPTETGMVEIRLKEKMQNLHSVVIQDISMLFSNHLDFFIKPPLLEQNISNMLSIMKIHYNVRQDFNSRITGFARDVARWAVSEEGPRMFCIEVKIEVIKNKVNDAQEDADDEWNRDFAEIGFFFPK